MGAGWRNCFVSVLQPDRAAFSVVFSSDVMSRRGVVVARTCDLTVCIELGGDFKASEGPQPPPGWGCKASRGPFLEA